ncbi:MAG: alpha/beta fold hydrolase [Chloroflexota bacterium]|nr:MAG: hypothetical protein DLM70_19065 [Chloroflexota bacterium]
MAVTGPVQVHSLLTGDGIRLSYRRFQASQEAERGTIVYLHGVQSHGGWYVDAGTELARNGYTVYMPDRRGSGSSQGPRGFMRDRRQLVDDLGLFVDLARNAHPDAPLFLIGNCWGAKPAVAFALRAQEQPAGLVLLCPGVITRVPVPKLDALKAAVGRVIGPRWMIRLPMTPEMYTADPHYLQFIREDPLALREATAHFCIESFLWERALPKQRDLRLPLLVMQAGEDPIVDIEATSRWFAHLTSQDKEWRDYPTFRHTLDFEERRHEVWNDLVRWLNQRTIPHSGAQEAVPVERITTAPSQVQM